MDLQRCGSSVAPASAHGRHKGMPWKLAYTEEEEINFLLAFPVN